MAKNALNGRKCEPAKKHLIQLAKWLPQETLDTIKEYLIAVKGPLQDQLVVVLDH